MIFDGIVRVLVAIPTALISVLPAAGSHAWVDGFDVSLFAAAYGFDGVLPLHELIALAGIFVPLYWSKFTFELSVFVYRLVHPFK